MANTNWTQADLDAIENAISAFILRPKEVIKRSIDMDNGGTLVYNTLKDLIEARDAIKQVIDSESNIDPDNVIKSAYQPYSMNPVNFGNL